jgi:hypothetical protein
MNCEKNQESQNAKETRKKMFRDTPGRMPFASSSVISLLLVAVLVLMMGLGARAQTTQLGVTLGWDPDTTGSIAGYIVYYGTNSGVYAERVDVGSSAQFTANYLIPGQNYYFAVSDYDYTGVESGLSGEVVYVAPPGYQISLDSSSPDYMGVKFPVVAGHWYEVQGSADLASWSTLWQTQTYVANDFIMFADFGRQQNSSQFFYRLVIH